MLSIQCRMRGGKDRKEVSSDGMTHRSIEYEGDPVERHRAL
jgi:hypothetical protein